MELRKNNNPDFILYPNPALSVIYFELESGEIAYNATLFSSGGKTLKEWKFEKNENRIITLNLPDVTAGLYILNLLTNQGFINKRILIQ
jgi:hypothetical protein